MNPARQVALKAGLPVKTPGQTVNRVCGSGLQAVVNATQGLKSDDGKLYIAGGIESMSRAPFLLPKHEQEIVSRHADMVDSILSEGLTDPQLTYAMGITAENVAEQWNITREQQDCFSFESQRRAAAAKADGAFAEELIPVNVPGRKGVTRVPLRMSTCRGRHYPGRPRQTPACVKARWRNRDSRKFERSMTGAPCCGDN